MVLAVALLALPLEPIVTMTLHSPLLTITPVMSDYFALSL